MSLQGSPWPTELRLHRSERRLEIDFDDGLKADIPAPLLRAMTPSAADRGHGVAADAPLAKDFNDIVLLSVHPVGSYAVRLEFNDGHDTGLYTWTMLYRIGRDKTELIAEQQRLFREVARASA